MKLNYTDKAGVDMLGVGDVDRSPFSRVMCLIRPQQNVEVEGSSISRHRTIALIDSYKPEDLILHLL